MKSSVFKDFILVLYEERRRELQRQYPDDGQGFYAADGHLRLRLGMDLTENHEHALIAETRAFAEEMHCKYWRNGNE